MDEKTLQKAAFTRRDNGCVKPEDSYKRWMLRFYHEDFGNETFYFDTIIPTEPLHLFTDTSVLSTIFYITISSEKSLLLSFRPQHHFSWHLSQEFLPRPDFQIHCLSGC